MKSVSKAYQQKASSKVPLDQNEVKSFCDVLESHLEKQTKERCYSFIKKGMLFKEEKSKNLRRIFHLHGGASNCLSNLVPKIF